MRLLSPLVLLGSVLGTSSMAPITLYTNRMCPFAQRCAVALERAGLVYESVEVNLYGSGGGFGKAELKAVEAGGGLAPKGYVPVLAIGGAVVRESSACVRAIAAAAAPALAPGDAAAADAMIALCDGALAAEGRACVDAGRKRSPGLDRCLAEIDGRLAATPFVAGSSFSTADAVLLPFLWRIRERLEIPAACGRLGVYLDRECAAPTFARTVADPWWWWW